MHCINLKRDDKMKEVYVKGFIVNKNENIILDGNGTLHENFISWMDCNLVKYIFDFKNDILIKEDENTKLELNFINNQKTECFMFLKEYNKTLLITILTTSCKKEANNFKTSYKIVEENNDENAFKLFLSWE